MTRFLTEDDLNVAAKATLGEFAVRDFGIWQSAVHRHKGTVFGEDVYPGLSGKAAALLHSIVGMHPLVDGNKRVGWIVTLLFYGMNGVQLRVGEDEAFDFVMSVAAGRLGEVEEIAKVLAGWEVR